MREKLIGAAIIRDDTLHTGWKSHWEIRAYVLRDSDSTKGRPGDDEGFLTSENRFVSRHDAVNIAVAAGQLHERWKDTRYGVRKLLSSDINW